MLSELQKKKNKKHSWIYGFNITKVISYLLFFFYFYSLFLFFILFNDLFTFYFTDLVFHP